MMHATRTGVACLLAACIASACATPAPDLKRLYFSQTGAEQPPPLVLVHGFMGAELRDTTGALHWPGTDAVESLRLDIDSETLAPLPSALSPSALADRGGGLSLDRSILDVLEGAGGYRRAEPGVPHDGATRRYYVFLYDWRQDNVVSARAFERFLAAIRSDYGDPDLAVDVVAHGIGGLLVRYYLRYGSYDTLNDNDFPVNYAGAAQLRRIVLLGVPNLGSVRAAQALLEGWPMPSGRLEPELLLTWPSTYQALPHPLSGWVIDERGESLGHDMFDAEIWRQLGLGPFDPAVRRRIAARFTSAAQANDYLVTLERYFERQIERARRFVWSLTVPAEELHERLIVMGGTCDPTPARVLLEDVDGEPKVRLFPSQVQRPMDGVGYERLMLEPGDGVITKSSLLARQALNPAVRRHMYSYFPLDYALFLCASHDRLTADVHLQNNLLNALLAAD